ncbi:maleylpyruvate isomerase family mycothiol-dependent enzyme [Amycolatopsis regifaucium]|uniref:DinB family protein n=1 Tax=Amycolatopsis regifaucium TaxID=546365 RepID=A0A154MUV2_9PSEU|nr:maleylpyruvate isomerase family mycothiol-dependent enzyme [Amycolatopsis regifaucium]KZB88065.1 DinB family protein [Amycolatopsis regifaucium]OKA04432.1 DinB family protein [Amycolatopsis regifaucium]SFH48971.1 TIGR03083 family protein [Amycolatopsis regifaucium]
MKAVARLAREERTDFAAFLRTLTSAQWDAPTLCAEWTVREVVTHVVDYDHLGFRELLGQALRGGLRLNRMNALGIAQNSERTPDELIARLEERLDPRGLTAAFGGRVALLDGLIHQQDIRRPLGLPREVPPERLRHALAFARFAPPIKAFQRARGLRLVATDVGWSAGSGPELRGPGEPLLMAIAGRRPAIDELSGPGAAILVSRMGA